MRRTALARILAGALALVAAGCAEESASPPPEASAGGERSGAGASAEVTAGAVAPDAPASYASERPPPLWETPAARTERRSPLADALRDAVRAARPAFQACFEGNACFPENLRENYIENIDFQPLGPYLC